MAPFRRTGDLRPASRMGSVMRNVVGSCLVGVSFCLWLGGCANPPPPPTSNAASRYAPASSYRTAQQGPAGAPAPIVRRFVGIPMPPNNLLDLDRTVVVGDSNDWVGRVFFSTPMTVQQAIEFYRQDMPRYGWIELAVTQSDTSVLAYQMGDRIATIELSPRPTTARTQVEFWVNPLHPAARQEEAAQPGNAVPPSAPIAAPPVRPARPPAEPVDGVSASFPAARAVQQAPLPPLPSP